MFCYATSMIILCVDGLTEAAVINHSKFATDTIIANVNICTVFLWLLLVWLQKGTRARTLIVTKLLFHHLDLDFPSSSSIF